MSTIWVVIHAYFVVLFYLSFPGPTTALRGGADVVKEGDGGYFPVPATARHGTVVKKGQRWHVASSEFGDISAVKVSDGKDGFYHLQFITMEPNSLFLPVHLHSDMVFYVDSGNGTLSWTNLDGDGDKLRRVNLQAGDVYRLRTGDVFYLQSNLEYDRRKLRINAIFSDSREELLEGSSSGAYSSIRDLVLGFDNKVLQAALNVKEEVIEELKRGERQAIVHGVAETVKQNLLEVHYDIMRAFLGGRMNINGLLDLSNKKKDKKKDDNDKENPYNVLDAKRDVENCNGWSLVVTSQQLNALNDSNFGVYMVNLTKGAMMGPHWNPTTAEIAVVLRGRGMVHVVCPSATNGSECKNSRFKVEEGDVFVVPRYHPMAQMSFNNESLIFVGFTTTTKNNHPQFLVGTASVFQTLDKRVLAASLGVSNTTMDQLLLAQREAIILECVSCAEEEERLVEEEIEREKEEEKKREEAAARKKEEEEAKRREEEKRKKEEEEEAKREEEAAEKARKEAEEARKREEEEARKREEEKRRQEEEEEARKREEEEARKREEEKRRQEEEEARRQEEEAARQQEEEEKRRQEEEEARRQEEEAARQQEEEERRKQEEVAKQWQRQREEEAKRKQEEEAAKQWERQREEESKRKQEEEAAKQWERQREEEAKRKQEEEAAKQWQRQQEEEAKRKQEEEAAKQWQRQQEEEAKRKQEEEAARHQQGGGGGGGGGGAAGWDEGEASRREEEEMARREQEAEAASRGGGGWQGNGRYEG
ncbi:hypothetical protein L6452_44129 [Arctium lappa]|uniref:Uncharacterized protein n=1 Tax=Arctium lappa TaxID=4217 RepID=A0ACB8XFL9_ARCLA|nr:hypothetical protein L6452_44129 [Arctium lappa]